MQKLKLLQIAKKFVCLSQV